MNYVLLIFNFFSNSLTSILFALAGGVLPALVWLAFWLREDIDHPEPRYLISLTFFSGALAVLGALFAEEYVARVISDQTFRYTLWAGLEEIFKLVCVSLIALHSKHFDEPIDAVIYFITIALGFSAVENTLFLLDPIRTGQISHGVAIETMRFVGATLVHVVCSAIIGFGIGYSYYRGLLFKITAVLLGTFAAITLHSLFNLFIIDATPIGTLKIFSWIWLSVILLLILFEEIKIVRPRQTA